MYQPPHFRVEDRAVLLDVIRANPLGLLITSGAGGLMANPIPFVISGEAGQERLRAHLARPNPQWREIDAGADPLVVFQSIDHYVSPGWYETKRETHKVVPTWNYIIVQIRGPARVDDSAGYLSDQIDQLTREHEGKRETRWSVTDAPADFIAAQMRGIVGVEIEMREISGKFKLSQNRPVSDQQGVHDGLAGEGDPDAEAMRTMIAAHLARRAV
jgi:transcriptional regulator